MDSQSGAVQVRHTICAREPSKDRDSNWPKASALKDFVAIGLFQHVYKQCYRLITALNEQHMTTLHQNILHVVLETIPSTSILSSQTFRAIPCHSWYHASVGQCRCVVTAPRFVRLYLHSYSSLIKVSNNETLLVGWNAYLTCKWDYIRVILSLCCRIMVEQYPCNIEPSTIAR